MASFIFGAPGLPKTPEELARRRQVAEALAARALGSHPTTIGDGLASIGSAIAARRINGRLDKAEAAGKESATAALNPLMAALSGTGAMTAPASTPSGQAIDNRVSQAFSGDQQEFFGSLTPAAIKASQATGIDPRIILAQAALESGYGKHAPGNNLFGIKSHGQEGGNTLNTTEVVNGKPVQTQASFRAYDDPNASVMGYADFINSNPRYAAFKSADGLDAQVAALGQSGYATDPDYAQKVASIAKGIRLPQVDQTTTGSVPGSPAPSLAAPQPVATPPAPPAQPMAQPGPDMQALSQQFGGSQQLAGADPRKGILTALLSGQQNGKAGFPAAPGQGGQNTMQALMAAMSNPWLNEGQKAVVGALLKQEIAKNDPGNALDAEYKRAQIEHLQQPDEPKIVELFDEKTGQPYKARYDTKTGQYERVGGIKAQSNGITIGPDGTVQIGGNMKLTEGQSKDLNYFQRANAALPTIDKFGKTLTDLKETAAGSVPVVGNYLTSPEYQQAQQAGREFLAAVLRKDSGAAITAQEFDLYGPMFLPQPGDTPEVLAQKQAARERAVQAIQGGLGNAKPMSEQPVTQNPSTNPSEPVTINGYTIQEVQ